MTGAVPAVDFAEVRVAVAGGRADAPDGERTVSLAVRTANLGGPAAPALLVHGLASNSRMWDGVAARLAGAGHPVAALDQRGHGRSDRTRTGYDWATLTDDLSAVLRALGWDGRRGGLPVVAGQSWGGNVVVELAARRPDALRAAVLVDGGTIELADRFADWPTCRAALAPPPLAGTNARRFETMLRSLHDDWPEEGVAGALANVERLPDGTIRPWLRVEDHQQILRLLWEHRPSLRWADITVPVLIVPADSGVRDARFMAAKREEVARAQRLLARGATRWVDGDHDLHAQHPEVVAALIHEAAAGVVFGD